MLIVRKHQVPAYTKCRNTCYIFMGRNVSQASDEYPGQKWPGMAGQSSGNGDQLRPGEAEQGCGGAAKQLEISWRLGQ